MHRISSSNDDPKEYELLLFDAPSLIVASLLSSHSSFSFPDIVKLSDSLEEEEELYSSSRLSAAPRVALMEVGSVRGWAAGNEVSLVSSG